MSRLFGWSYPPGCSGLPGDDCPEPPECCGDFMDETEDGAYVCPECGKRIESPAQNDNDGPEPQDPEFPGEYPKDE